MCKRLWVILLCLPAVAEPRLIPLTPRDVPAAVGKVMWGPGRTDFCTGTLIAPDLVLTAAHCASGEGKRFVLPKAGLSRQVASAEANPAYGARGYHHAEGDIGLLRLERPVTEVAPIPVFGVLRDTVSVYGFRHSAPGRTFGSEACPVLAVQDTTVLLGCVVVGGHSGSPVLADQPGGAPAIIGVISSRSDVGAFAAQVSGWLLDRLRE